MKDIRPVAAYRARPWPNHIYGELELENVQKWVWLLSLRSMAVPLPNCLLHSPGYVWKVCMQVMRLVQVGLRVPTPLAGRDG